MSIAERVPWENTYLKHIFSSFQWVNGIWFVIKAWVCLEHFLEESRSDCPHKESHQPFLWWEPSGPV